MKKHALIVFTLFTIFSLSQNGNAQDIVDPSTLDNKIMSGYQGWFGAAGDGSGYSWIHWSGGATPNPDNISFDMWPDMREYDADELYETDFVYSDLSNGGLFSSYNPKTVDRHVLWMKEYGIDGVFVQRFISSALGRTDQRDTVLQNVRHAAENHGRVFANMYDLSGGKETVVEDVKNDWMHIVDDLKMTESPSYLNHNGRPVLAIWGFNVGNTKENLTAPMAAELVQWLTIDAPAKYLVTLMGGVNDNWRTQDPEWQAVYDSLDVISPWAVGRYGDIPGADNFRNNNIVPDLANTQTRNLDYMPVIFPGFSWYNLKGEKFNHIKRNGGTFFWRQMFNAIDAGCNMVYIAMYDEVDEGTAIFKTAENASQTPTKGRFANLDIDGYELPSDWYLRLSGEGTKMLRQEIPLTVTIPIVPFPDNSEFKSQDAPTIVAPGTTQSVSLSFENSGITSWTNADTFKLVDLASESAVWGIMEIELGPGETIAPGESKTFTFDITAPAAEGVYKFQWQMTRDSVGLFGDLSDMRLINVSSSVNFLDDCDMLTDWDPAASLTLNSTDQKQGTACIEFSGGTNDPVEFQKVFAAPYNSGITAYDAVLQFWYHVSDVSLVGAESQVQLGSGGALDTDAYSWTVTGLETGWNLLTLNVRDAELSGSPDLNAINWFILTNPKTGDAITRIDEIQVFDMYAGATKYELIVNDGTGDGSYIENEIINISADEAPPAQRFIGWEVNSGDPVIEDMYAESTSLKMSGSDVEISALYKVLGIYLDDCDQLKDWGSHGPLSLNSTDQQEGLACIEFAGDNTDEFRKSFSTPYNTGASVETGRLQFWYYVSDPSRMEADNQVELGSAGGHDVDEYNWDIGVLLAGWNFISLEFSAASVDGEPDLSAINWFRLFHYKSDSVTTRIDAIEIVDPAAGARYPLTVYSGSGDGNYYSGIEILISAEAAPEGMMFASWEVNSGNPDIANVNAASTTLTMPASAVIITATYTEIQRYTLTVNFGNGSGSYIPGETVTLFASGGPSGYLFEQWVIESGSPTIANVNSAFTTLTMSADDAVVTATFRDPTVGIANSGSYDQSLTIYPNPAQTEINVDLRVEKPTELNISIFDLQGREVGKGIKKAHLNTGNHVLTLPVSGLETGTYLMKIITDSRIYTELVVIQ
jgi:hypothetical protein